MSYYELQAELQRVSGTTLDAQGAANVWAGTTGLDLLGALNAKAASSGRGLEAVIGQLSSASGGGDVLASVSYDPAATVTKTPTTSMVVLDATNLSVTFTAPASGAVLVTLSAATVQTGAGNWYFGIVDSGGTERGKSLARFDVGPGMHCTVRIRIAGLTPGGSYTYRFAHQGGAGTVAGSLYYGNSGGGIPATMTVEAT